MAERPEDLNLPNSVIAKIIKEALPEGAAVSKDARLAISKAASVFVLYSTSCANNFSMQQKRKTISGQDVLEAMKEMEFDRFIEPLKKSLEAYKLEHSKGKKDGASDKKKKDSTSPAKPNETDADEMDVDDTVETADDDEDDDVEN